MNKALLQSPGSAASSETSETQSVTDEPVSRQLLKTAKKAKEKEVEKEKDKEKEKERPPWRSTTAPAVKVDKSALLRAKLRDASRRALLFQRNITRGCQTDPISTKLFKDIQTDTQGDLILVREKAVETDGMVTLKSESFGGFILTQTVGQMTDAISLTDFGTQTAQPRSNLSYSQYLMRDSPKTSRRQMKQYPEASLDDIINKNTQILEAQMKEIQRLREELNGNTKANNEEAKKSITEESTPPDSLIPSCDNEQNNDKSRANSPKRSKHRSRRSAPLRRSLLSEPTINSWEDFDSTDEDDLPVLPRRYMSDGRTPWADFNDMIIGKRVANMRLSPIPPRVPSYKKKSVSWSDSHQQAVSELITEANALIDVFDQVSSLLGPQLKYAPPKNIDQHTPFMPPPKWEPVLEKSYQALEEKLKDFKPHRFRDDLERKRLDDLYDSEV